MFWVEHHSKIPCYGIYIYNVKKLKISSVTNLSLSCRSSVVELSWNARVLEPNYKSVAALP